MEQRNQQITFNAAHVDQNHLSASIYVMKSETTVKEYHK